MTKDLWYEGYYCCCRYYWHDWVEMFDVGCFGIDFGAGLQHLLRVDGRLTRTPDADYTHLLMLAS